MDKKFLLVTSFFPFGKRENWLKAEVEALSGNGVHVIVVPRKQGSIKELPESTLSYELINEPMLSLEIAIYTLVNIFVIFSKKNILNIKQQSYSIFDFTKRLLVLPKAYIIARKLSNRSIAHIHAYSTTSVATMATILGEQLGVDYSFTLHTSSQLVERHRASYGYLIRHAKFVRTISSKTQADLHRFFADLDFRTEKVCLGVDIPKAARSLDGAFDRKSILTMACVLEPYKGVHVAIEAMKLLKPHNSGLILEIYGDGSLRGQLEKQVEELGLSGAVKLSGHIAHADLLKMLDGRRNGTILLTSTVVDHVEEGIPVILMEAMARGMIPVVTDNGGINEIVQDGVNGYVVRQGDAEAVAERIQTLIDAPDPQVEALSSAGMSYVRDYYDIDKNVAQAKIIFEG